MGEQLAHEGSLSLSLSLSCGCDRRGMLEGGGHATFLAALGPLLGVDDQGASHVAGSREVFVVMGRWEGEGLYLALQQTGYTLHVVGNKGD